MKKVLSISVTSVLLLSTLCRALPAAAAEATPTPNWGRSADGYYYINNASELLAFAQGATEANSYYKGQVIVLKSDIDLTGVTWTMIPKFCGTLEGRGHAIRNLTMSSDTTRCAFIDVVDGATFRDLSFIGGSITLTGKESGDGSLGAVIAVEAKGAPVTFENVYVNSTLSAPGLGERVDGVKDISYRQAGFVAMAVNDVNIAACASDVSLKIFKCAAGFVAANAYGSTVTITDSAFGGSFHFLTGEEQGAFMGRVVGNLTLERCAALGADARTSSNYSGNLFYADNRCFIYDDLSVVSTIVSPEIVVKDCYVTRWDNRDSIIGTHGTRAYFKLTVSYTGDDAPIFVSDGKSKLISDELLVLPFRTFAVGYEQFLTKDNLDSYPTLSEFVVVGDETVTFKTGTAIAEPMVVVKLLPKNVYAMLQGTFTPGELPAVTAPEEPIPTETTPQSTEDGTSATDKTPSRKGKFSPLWAVPILAILCVAGIAVAVTKKKK